MRTEEATPETERVLYVESRADARVLADLGTALPPRAAGEEVLFLSFAYADVPLGRRYECCFPRADERDVTWVTATVVAVTQQFGKPFTGIPHGWKTLALLRFEPEVPELVRALPTASAWYEHPATVHIADRATWEARRREYGGDDGFGAVLRRWTEHRRTDSGALSRQTGLPEERVRGVLGGGPASPSLLRRLGPALGLPAADVFVLAGQEVPDDLAPLDPRAGRLVPDLVRHAVELSPDGIRAVRGFVASLPQEKPVAGPPEGAAGPAPRAAGTGPGALLMRLVGNRNLGLTATAKTFALLTGRYWSPATYGVVARGGIEVTADLLADFAAVLGVPAPDLAVLCGAPAGEAPAPATGPGELISDVRRLTADRMRQVIEAARAQPS
ncbi:hypothetical protein [Streptomyces sp. CoH27]|uniref:hypothetical protein n=1 Tax=Streptomyces sp. CoH27 TaxID=2875763 RepID=UPI001CD41378|nr:hypothetical protein [Streptomyces sp. CoH27]